MTKRAFITGQDGSYLAEFLLEHSYEVHGLVRRVAIEDPEHRLYRIKHITDQLTLHPVALENYAGLFNVVERIRPHYHLAAQSFVSYSFEDEFSLIHTNINGAHHVLSVLKERVPACRFYFAASSEMFGNAQETPQDEQTPFRPRSAYGISKVAGFHLTNRDTHHLFAASGILYNHESPRRGYEFVTRKITNRVAQIKLGLADELRLGNLAARRDWGYSKDYVKAMWMMLQQEQPDDYVVARGETHSVEEFVGLAFGLVGLDWKDYVVVDERFYRPAETFELRGNTSKARKQLGWESETSFEDLVRLMVESDVQRLGEKTQFDPFTRPVVR